MSNRNRLADLLNSAFDGINVIFGNDSNTFTITNSSIVMKNYNIENVVNGYLGIIGPSRLDYSKIIPYIEYFSNCITDILSEDRLGGDTDVHKQKG